MLDKVRNPESELCPAHSQFEYWYTHEILSHESILGNIKCTDEENCADDNHGFHVHQNAPTRVNGIYDCGTAGGHFAAEDQIHARPSSSKRYLFLKT